jgi:hypothetical protein
MAIIILPCVVFHDGEHHEIESNITEHLNERIYILIWNQENVNNSDNEADANDSEVYSDHYHESDDLEYDYSESETDDDSYYETDDDSYYETDSHYSESFNDSEYHPLPRDMVDRFMSDCGF